MYGNTDALAHAISDGIGGSMQVAVVNVNHVAPESLQGIDLLVVGGPTHVHGMSREGTRVAAASAATEELPLDDDARGTGVREWLGQLATSARYFAAFDTRIDMPKWMTGSAGPQISRLLASRGLESVAEPKDFLVTDATRLEPAELDHAKQWGADVAAAASTLLLKSPVNTHPVQSRSKP